VDAALNSTAGGQARFNTTNWGLVAVAANDQEALNSQVVTKALEDLYRTYCYPVYAFIRRRGRTREEAQDLTQDFFVHLLERNTLRRADPDRGKFRSFLLGALEFFLAQVNEKASALKRGGKAEFVFLDNDSAEVQYQLVSEELSAERVFEIRWAASLISAALQSLRSEMVREGKADVYETLQGFLLGEKSSSYQEVAERLGFSIGAMKTVIRRLRARYRTLLREEVAQTVVNPDDIDNELMALRAVLSSGHKRPEDVA
jgi:RNA polymerase sigma-70 factor (ECF subfamily)